MKKLLLYIFLATFFSNVSFADWLFGSKTKNDTWYYEGSSIVKEGDIMYVWILTDYNSIGRLPNYSTSNLVNAKE